MDLSKLFLLSFLISLSMCNGDQLPKLWNPIKNVPTYAPNLRQCFCYPQMTTGTPVLEKLTNNGENVQRLVLYLYKYPTSNEIKLFVPNNQKQKVIPDLTFDEGDQLEAPSDNLQAIFTKYPDLVSERSHIRPRDTPNYEHPIRKIKGINVPSEQHIISLYNDDMVYDNHMPPRSKNTRNPTRSDSDSDVDYVQPYFDFEGNTPNAPINVISVNINRKKADPNMNNLHRGNRIRITRPNRGQFNSNFDSNNDLDDVIVEYPENSEIEETNTSPEAIESLADDGDNIDAPDPEETQAENDFMDMPPELTDEITTNFDEPTPVQTMLNTIPTINPKKLTIETHTVPSDMSNTDAAPTTDAPIDIDIINKVIKPEIQIQDSLDDLDPELNDVVPLVENDSLLQPELPIDDKGESNNIENLNKPGNGDEPDDFINYNFQPHQFIGPNNKPTGNTKISTVPVNVQKKLIDTFFPHHKLPLDYIKNEIFRNRQLIPGDLSFFTVDPETLLKKYHGADGIDFQDTFDNWFDQQMKRVRFVNSRASNSIDIYTLKYLIEKTLHEKGMFVTEKGYIIDSDGRILNTANLGLRPILIGNSVEYKNLLQGKFNSYKLPMDMPYLEAVLITSIDPPKILGIIPLGKTYLPKTIQKPLPYYIDNGIIRNSCGGVCNMRNMLMPSLNTRRHRGKTYIGPRPIKTRVTQQHAQGRQRTPITRRIFPFDEVNSFIDKIYRVPLRQSKVIQRPSTYVVDYETGPLITRQPVIKYPIPIAVSEVTPGFRIIGGNPATSSGTPVSSRGRSGYDSMESALTLDDEN